MKARHWMVAGLIGLVGMSNAVAADLDRQDQGSTGHAGVDNGLRDAGGAGSDVLLPVRDSHAARHGNDTETANETEGRGAAGGSERSGRTSAAPTTARPTTVGWQSLLPGSIQ